MNFELSEAQTMLKDSIERFLAKEYDFATRRKIVAGAEGLSRAAWQGFAELGLLGIKLPDEAGGMGAGAIEILLIMEAFGRALVVEPFLSTVVLGAEAVARLGDTDQQATILPSVIAGELTLAFAHAEPQRTSDNDTLTTVARRVGNDWLIDGAKIGVLGAPGAGQLLVSAALPVAGRTPGMGVFLVPRETAGVAIDAYEILDGSRAGDVTLSQVRVADAAWLGHCDDAAPVVEELLDGARLALTADALGVMDALVEATLSHARSRVQYGQPIGKFQVLQHRMVDMAVLREEARSLTILAAVSISGPVAQRQRAISAAKIKVGRAVKQIAEQAVQIHGAMGVTDELNIGAYLNRALVYNLSFGSVDDHLQRYASLTCGPEQLARSVTDVDPWVEATPDTARQATT